jgi:hypothetical protein
MAGAGQSGGRSPGDNNHSFMRDAVSNCRACRSTASRVAPGGSVVASMRHFSACRSQLRSDLYWAGTLLGWWDRYRLSLPESPGGPYPWRPFAYQPELTIAETVELQDYPTSKAGQQPSS